jgi:hypothetical protein
MMNAVFLQSFLMKERIILSSWACDIDVTFNLRTIIGCTDYHRTVYSRSLERNCCRSSFYRWQLPHPEVRRGARLQCVVDDVCAAWPMAKIETARVFVLHILRQFFDACEVLRVAAWDVSWRLRRPVISRSPRSDCIAANRDCG